ncbi:MAG: hypothetical protein ACLSE8_05010 [Parasutterella sp.]
MAGDGNYAKQLSDGFDPCSLQGMEDAPQGWIVEGNINDSNQFKTDRRQNKLLRKNNADYNWGGEHWFKATEDSAGHWGGTKACVRGYQGTAYEAYSCYDSSGDSSYSTTCYRPVEKFTRKLFGSNTSPDERLTFSSTAKLDSRALVEGLIRRNEHD